MGQKQAPPKAAHDVAREGDGVTYGLILDARPDADGIPTVPATPHTVAGLPGYYTTVQPTPVGGPGETTLAQAVAASKDPGCGVTLVTVTDAAGARAAHDAHIAAGRNVVAEIVRDPEQIDTEAEAEQINDEAAAIGAGGRV